MRQPTTVNSALKDKFVSGVMLEFLGLVDNVDDVILFTEELCSRLYDSIAVIVELEEELKAVKAIKALK
jgi:hypothetical protein